MPASPNAPSPVQRRPIRTLADADAAVRRLEGCVVGILGFPPLESGYYVLTLTVTGVGTEKVAHGLGRPIVGYAVVRSDAVRSIPALSASDNQLATFTFGVAGTLTILVW